MTSRAQSTASAASSLPTEPSVISARLRLSGNAVQRAIASADDRSSLMVRRIAKTRQTKGLNGTGVVGSGVVDTSALGSAPAAPEGLVLDGRGHVLGVRTTQEPSAGSRQRRTTGRAVLSLPRPPTNVVVGTDDSSDSDAHEPSMLPPDPPSSRGASSAPARAMGMPAADTNSAAPTIYINGVQCDASGDRIIPDLLFGPHVLLMDNTTGRLLLPNGVDGSVRVVSGRDYSTVRLRGGTADLIFAGVLEDDRRLVPRSWIFETVSAAYRAGSAQFYDSVPTIGEYIKEVRELDPRLPVETALQSHPVAVCEQQYRNFHKALASYRKSAAEQVPVRGSAANASQIALTTREAEDTWASAAAGKNRKHVTAFGVFLRENAGVNMVSCAAAFAALSADEKQRYTDLAAEFNLRAEEGHQQAIVMTQLGTQLLPSATQLSSRPAAAATRAPARRAAVVDDDEDNDFGNDFGNDGLAAAPASAGSSFDDPHLGSERSAAAAPKRGRGAGRRSRSAGGVAAPKARRPPVAEALPQNSAAPAPTRSAFAALAAASSQLSASQLTGGLFSQSSMGGTDYW